MLDKIEDPIDYIKAITKLLPYAIDKKKKIVDVQETELINILIKIDGQKKDQKVAYILAYTKKRNFVYQLKLIELRK